MRTLVFAAVLCSTSVASAADLYVATTGSDANPGTAAKPMRSPIEALKRAAPGDVVRVRAGVYAGGGWIDKKGKDGMPIRVVSEDGPRKAILEGGDETLRLGDGASYLRFEGLEVRNSKNNLIHVDGGAHHIWFIDLYAHDAGPDGDVVKVNQSHHIVIDGMEAARAGKRTIVSPPYQECIDFVDVDHSLVTRSYLHDNGGSIIYAKGGSKRVVFERNVIAGQRAGGENDPAVGIGGWTDADLFGGEVYEALDVVLRNNLIVGNAHGAIAIYDARGATVANNLLLDNDVVGILIKQGNGPSKKSDDVRVVSNIIVDTRGKMPTPFLKQGTHSLTGLYVTDNLYWNTGAAIPATTLVTSEPGRFVGDPKIATAPFASWSAAVAAFKPGAPGDGADTSGAPYGVVDDITGALRSGTRHRGPYRLGAPMPVDAGAPDTDSGVTIEEDTGSVEDTMVAIDAPEVDTGVLLPEDAGDAALIFDTGTGEAVAADPAGCGCRAPRRSAHGAWELALLALATCAHRKARSSTP